MSDNDDMSKGLAYPLDLDWDEAGNLFLRGRDEGEVDFFQARVPGGTLVLAARCGRGVNGLALTFVPNPSEDDVYISDSELYP